MKENYKPTIYMAELTYDTTVVSNEYFPIAVGYIIAYAEKYFPNRVNYKIFNFPNDLFDAIDKNAPDILGLSYFPWNNRLSLKVAKYYKKVKPDGIVIFGGGDLPLEEDRKRLFFVNNPQVDVFVTYDGEFGFLEILKKYFLLDGKKTNIFSGDPIDGCVYADPVNQQCIEGKIILRPKNLDEIPSPYLTGLMDPFFDNQQLTPRVQSTRGCPFTCSYCWAACEVSSHVSHFSINRVEAELKYIADKRASKTNRQLLFCDTNFGMYDKDEKIGDFIAFLQETSGFPSSFEAPGTQKHRDRLYRIIRKIRNARANISVQSTDSNILSNVKRQPVQFSEYKKTVEMFHKLGVPVVSEVITGLPGETRKTHLQTLRDLVMGGADEIDAFTLMLLEGTELTSPESQEKNKWVRKYRILPRDFGKYRGEICFEVETVAVGSVSYSFEDYLFFRGLHGALKIIYNNAFFTEFTAFLKFHNIDLFDFSLNFYKSIQIDNGLAGKQFRSFLNEAKTEIWDSREELIKYFESETNYKKLVSGEVGENLMVKYKAMMICDGFDDWCNFFYSQVLIALKNLSNQKVLQSQLKDIKKHILAKAGSILSIENSQGIPVIDTFEYDIYKWAKDGYSKSLDEYRFNSSSKVSYVINDRFKDIVSEILSVSITKSTLWKAVGNRYYLPALMRIPKVIK